MGERTMGERTMGERTMGERTMGERTMGERTMGACCHKSLYGKLPDPFSPTGRRHIGSGYARQVVVW